MYKVPNEYYYRIHHVRPRFKNDVENVLIFIATELSKLGEMEKGEYSISFNNAIRKYPGNSIKKKKTISNWRTEISALFGFTQTEEIMVKPGRRAIELADKQDLVEAFKIFLYFFQYPGGHTKPHETMKYIESGINFKPAKYILSLLEYVEKTEGKRIGINKAEATHCIFNDMRCTRDNQDPSLTWSLIKRNRDKKIEYDWTGDVIRYAGDILDYMEIANLLVSHGTLFYLNEVEKTAIKRFIASSDWFDGYDHMIKRRAGDIKEINEINAQWFDYANQQIDDELFKTDIFAFISSDEGEYEKLKHASLSLFENKLDSEEVVRTKEIGDWGESLVFGHEYQRVKLGGRSDLLHLIKLIPTAQAQGYDIQSVELDAIKRYIEVKTTISSKPIQFNKIHLTDNEWNAARTLNDRYFIYRLYLNKENKKLYIMQDPVRLYKENKIDMSLKDGADIFFKPETSGQYEELLSWED